MINNPRTGKISARLTGLPYLITVPFFVPEGAP
jgi:hypothetical protein